VIHIYSDRFAVQEKTFQSLMSKFENRHRKMVTRNVPGYNRSLSSRMRLERLCRYVGRPPVALDRLSTLADGRLKYRLKRRWRDGTTHVIFEPLEFIEKLAALVPTPKAVKK
jgi:hypothetical protein